MNYVIIGNSIAATACIEGIRSVDKKGAITVISAEKYPVYGQAANLVLPPRQG